MNTFKSLILLILALVVANGCKIGYSFTGASVSPDVKSYTIYDFPNRARLVNPTFSDYFGEKLRERFTRQTSLDYVNDGGDLEFEGAITGYDIQPMAIKTDDQASMNRLTARISVKFTNNKDHEKDFETEFSAYAEFNADQLLSDVEDALVEVIVKEIIDEVYNKSVANW